MKLDIFYKKKDRNALYLLYDTLLTYVPVSGLSNASFRAGNFLAISAQTGSNWFLLIFQTAKLTTKKER